MRRALWLILHDQNCRKLSLMPRVRFEQEAFCLVAGLYMWAFEHYRFRTDCELSWS